MMPVVDMSGPLFILAACPVVVLSLLLLAAVTAPLGRRSVEEAWLRALYAERSERFVEIVPAEDVEVLPAGSAELAMRSIARPAPVMVFVLLRVPFSLPAPPPALLAGEGSLDHLLDLTDVPRCLPAPPEEPRALLVMPSRMEARS